MAPEPTAGAKPIGVLLREHPIIVVLPLLVVAFIAGWNAALHLSNRADLEELSRYRTTGLSPDEIRNLRSRFSPVAANPEPASNEGSTKADPESGDERLRQRLRALHQVRAMTDVENELPRRQTPKGVYGFAASPASYQAMYSKRARYLFEVHKAANGEEYLLGYVSNIDASTVAAGRNGAIAIFTVPWDEASTLVALPLSMADEEELGRPRGFRDGRQLLLHLEAPNALSSANQ